MNSSVAIVKVLAFLRLSRIKFLVPGLSPFTAGIILGLLTSKSLSIPFDLVILSYVGLIFIMLTTYYSNEYFDYLCDMVNREYTKFSGGSRVLVEKLLSRRVALMAFILSIAILICIAVIYLMYYVMLRPLLLPMAIIGVISGIFYTTPPFKWSYRGLGEVLIGFCYGWLTLVSGYYIVTGSIDLLATIASLPATFSIFAVILINEFSDYKADSIVGKKTLVVRFGLNKASLIYFVAMICVALFELYACYILSSFIGLLFGLPISILAIMLALNVYFRKVYTDKLRLEKVQANTILINALSSYPPIIALLSQSW